MIDVDVLIEKVNRIQNYLKRIHDTVKGDLISLDDLDTQDIVVLNLQRAVQLSIDIAFHVILTEKYGIPQDLKEAFQLLQKNRVISGSVAEKMQKMVGFRNIAVHDYQAIDEEILRKIVSHHLKDIEEFYTPIVQRYQKG